MNKKNQKFEFKGPSVFRAPFGVDPYIDEVKDRIAIYIEKQIWDSTDQPTLDLWLSQFTTIEEKYFAAIILDNIIYRSRSQIISLCEQLLHTIIPNTPIFKSLEINKDCDWYRKIKTTFWAQKIVFCPVLKIQAPPTKSSFVILREIQHQFQIPNSCFIWPQKLKEIGSNVLVVFLDDFLGTGIQFGDFAKEYSINFESHSKFLYCPLIATQKGLKNISEKFPHLQILPVEITSDTERVIKDGATKFIDGINSEKDAKEFYLNMIKKWNFGNKFRLGFEECANLIIFSHGSPNNSLPILWSETPNFTPLFRR